MTAPFADRLDAAIARTGSPCCIGLDPRLDWLPARLRSSLLVRPTAPAIARAVIELHRRILPRLAPIVPIVKPQLAFFEQLGAPGIEAYEDLVRRARELGLLVIADAKRGDIGTTADAYARAFLGGVAFHGTDVSPPPADALTVQPYFGTDGVQPFLDACDRTGGGLFVLAKTSNPSASEIQDLPTGKRRVVDVVAEAIARWGEPRVASCGYSSVGAVVGATQPRDVQALRSLMPRAIFLLPGYGAQGGTADDVVGAFDARGRGALVVAARSVYFAYRRNDGSEVDDFESAVESAARAMTREIQAALARAGKPCST